MLYAGNTLVGAALLFTIVLTAITLPSILANGGSYVYRSIQQPRHHGHHAPVIRRLPTHSLSAYLSLLTRLCAVFGGITLLAAMLVTANTLVNIQFPIGDWYSTGDPSVTDLLSQDHVGPWMIGRAVGLCVAGSILAVIAGWIGGCVWEGPSVGVVEKGGRRRDEYGSGEGGGEEVAAGKAERRGERAEADEV